MTTQWRLFSAPQVISTVGGNWYGSLFGYLVKSEANLEVRSKIFTAVTFTDLRVNCSAVDVGEFVQLLKNGSSSNVRVNVTSSGWIEDLTDSGTFAANDEAHYQISNNGMHGDRLNIDTILVTMEHASINAPIMGFGFQNTISATRYSVMGSTGAAEVATEADAAHKVKRAQIASNLRVNIVTATSADWDVSPFINGSASTNVTLNITGTGTSEDITSSEAYAPGDTISWGRVQTGGSMSADVIQLDIDTAEVFLNCTFSSNIGSTRVYIPFDGRAKSTSVDDNYFMRIGSVLAGNLQCFVDSAAATSSVSARVDAVNSTNLTIDTSTSGYLEDLTGSDSIADGTSLQITAIATSGTLTIAFVALECPFSVVATGGRNRYHITSS